MDNSKNNIGIFLSENENDNIPEQLLKLFDIISSGREKCNCCEFETYYLFGGFCNNCLTSDIYFYNVKMVENIIFYYIDNGDDFLDFFDLELYKHIVIIKNSNNNVVDMIIYIKICILQCIRKNVLEKKKNKVKNIFGSHFYFYLNMASGDLISDRVYNILNLTDTSVNISTRITLIEEFTPCFCVSIIGIFDSLFSVTIDIYFFTDHITKLRRKYCGIDNNFIDLSSSFTRVISSQGLMCFKLKLQSVITDALIKKLCYSRETYTSDNNLGTLMDYCKSIQRDMNDELMEKSLSFNTAIRNITPHSYEFLGMNYVDYSSLWGKFYFILSKPEKKTITLTHDTNFIFLIGKYCPVRPVRCIYCSKNIDVCVLGNCNDCIFNVWDIIDKNILDDYKCLLRMIKKTNPDMIFVRIIQTLIGNMKDVSRNKKINAYDYIRGFSFVFTNKNTT
jgi:hypothetical protein